jgi:hypothetical protein
MATPLFSFTTLNGSDPAGHDSINVLIKSIEDQLASVSSGLSTGADTPGSVTTGQVLRWSGTTYANALVNAASLDTGAVTEAKIASSAVTETKIADSAVTSAKIANDTIVNADINSSAGIVDTKLATISTAGKVANSATTAASANGNNTIVQRDASGNFSADTITAGLSGTATSATNIVGGSAGSVPYQTGTSATGMLANGSAGEVLTSNGTTLAPSWEVASIGEANIATGAVTSAKIADGTIVAGDISSTYPGHMALTTTQKNALTDVTTGTMVYDSTLGFMQVWNGTIWTFPTRRIGVRVNKTSNFGAGGDISWNNVTYDTDPNGAMWSLATTPERIYIKTAGLYLVTLQGAWTATATATPYVTCHLIKNGAYAATNNPGVSSTTSGYLSLSAQVQMSVGDYFKFQVTVTGVSTPIFQGNTLYDNTTTSATITLLGT